MFKLAQGVEPKQVYEIITNEPEISVEFIDIRSEAEFEGAHIKGSKRVLARDFGRTLLDVNVLFIIVDRDGVESKELCHQLEGFHRNIVYLKGGLKAWIDEGYF